MNSSKSFGKKGIRSSARRPLLQRNTEKTIDSSSEIDAGLETSSSKESSTDLLTPSVSEKFVSFSKDIFFWQNGKIESVNSIVSAAILDTFHSLPMEQRVLNIRKLLGLHGDFIYKSGSADASASYATPASSSSLVAGNATPASSSSLVAGTPASSVIKTQTLPAFFEISKQVLHWGVLFAEYLDEEKVKQPDNVLDVCLELSLLCHGILDMDMLFPFTIQDMEVTTKTEHAQFRLVGELGSLSSLMNIYQAKFVLKTYNRDTRVKCRLRSLHFAVATLLKLSSTYKEFSLDADYNLLTNIKKNFSANICGYGKQGFDKQNQKPPEVATVVDRLSIAFQKGPMKRKSGTSGRTNKRISFQAEDGLSWRHVKVRDLKGLVEGVALTTKDYIDLTDDLDRKLISSCRSSEQSGSSSKTEHQQKDNKEDDSMSKKRKRGSTRRSVKGSTKSHSSGSTNVPQPNDRNSRTSNEKTEGEGSPQEVCFKYPLYSIPDDDAAARLRPDSFLPLFDYARGGVCNQYFEWVKDKFESKSLSALQPSQIGENVSVTQFQYRPLKDQDIVCQVINVKQVFSKELTEWMISEIDKLSFLASSKDVGNKQVSKMRALRAAMRADVNQPRSAFLISKDFIATDNAQKPELFALNLVTELMQGFDKILEDAYSDRKVRIAKWCPEKVVIHTTVGTDDGSPYALHQDSKCGMNHSYQTYDLIYNHDTRMILLTLPPQMLIRVINIVYHTNCDDTETAQVCFEPFDKEAFQPTDAKIHQYRTDSCTLSIMNCTVQWFLMHKVINISSRQKAGGSRIMTTFRVTLSGLEYGVFENIVEAEGLADIFHAKKNDYICSKVVTAMYNNLTNLAGSKTDLAAWSPTFNSKETHVSTSNATPVLSINTVKKAGLRVGEVGAASQLSAREHLSQFNRSGIEDISFWRSICKGVLKKDPTLDTSFLSRDGFRTIEDPYYLWERLTGTEMVEYFHNNKIELILEFEKKGKVFYGRYGRPPEMPVVTNWPDDWSSVVGTFVPQEEIRRIRPGDIVNENTVRSHYQITATNRTNPPWKTIHPAVSDVLVLKQDYKNNHKLLKQLYHEIRSGVDIHPMDQRYSDLWAALNGGSGIENGTYAVALKKRNQETLPSSLSLPSWQRDDGVKQFTFRSMERRRSSATLFTKPPGVPKEKLDRKEYLHYCGQFTPVKLVTESEEDDSVLDSFVSPLANSSRLFCSYLLGSHTKGYINKAYSEHFEGNEEGWRVIKMRIGDSNSFFRLKFPVDVSHGRDSAWINMKRLRRKTVAKLIQQTIIPSLLGDEDNVTNILDEKSFIGKEAQLLHDGTAVSVSLGSFINAILRCSVAGAMRYLRTNVVEMKNTDYARYLMDKTGQEAGPQRYLGLIMRTTPLPMPIRTYDKTTCMLLIQSLTSLEKKFSTTKDRKGNGRLLVRPSLSKLSSNEIHQLLLTCLINRSTGNPEPIRDFFDFVGCGNKKKSKSGSLFKLFSEEDIVSLTAFMCFHCATINNKQEDMNDGSCMSTWISPQFKESVPLCAKACPRSLKEFLTVASYKLRDVSETFSTKELTRNDAREHVFLSISQSVTKKTKCQKSLRFFANQVLLDFEELVSGNDGPWSYPFNDTEKDPERIVLGYGSSCGLSIYLCGIPVIQEARTQTDFSMISIEINMADIEKLHFIEGYVENESNQFASEEALNVLGVWFGEECDDIFDNSLVVVQHTHPIMQGKAYAGDILHSFSIKDGSNNDSNITSQEPETGVSKPCTFQQFQDELQNVLSNNEEHVFVLQLVRGICSYPSRHRKTDEPIHLSEEKSTCEVGYDNFYRRYNKAKSTSADKSILWRKWLSMTPEQRDAFYLEIDDKEAHASSGDWEAPVSSHDDSTHQNKKLSLDESFNLAAEEILQHIRVNMDDLLLGCLGLERIVAGEKTIVVVSLNGRELRRFDVEHKFCKIYDIVDRARGGRSLSVPNPFSVHCWPCKRSDTICQKAIDANMKRMINSFEQGIQDGLIGELKAPFTYITDQDYF